MKTISFCSISQQLMLDTEEVWGTRFSLGILFYVLLTITVNVAVRRVQYIIIYIFRQIMMGDNKQPKTISLFSGLRILCDVPKIRVTTCYTITLHA